MPVRPARRASGVDFDEPARGFPAELFGGGVDQPVAEGFEVFVADGEAGGGTVAAVAFEQVLLLTDSGDDVEAGDAAGACPALFRAFR